MDRHLDVGKPVPPTPPSTPTVPSALAAPLPKFPCIEDWMQPPPKTTTPDQLPPMHPDWDDESDPRTQVVKIPPPSAETRKATPLASVPPPLASGTSSSSLYLDQQPITTPTPPAATPPPTSKSAPVPRSEAVPIGKISEELAKAADGEGSSLDSLSPSSPDDHSDLLERRRVVMAGTIIDVDEDQEHEFKAVQVARRPDEQIVDYVEKYANAFLNTKGGIVYFGVEDNGRIVGIPMNRAMRDSLRLRCDQMIQTYRPRVDPTLWSLEFISVERNTRQTKPGKQGSNKDSRGKPKKGGKLSKRDEERGVDPMPILYVVALHVSKGRAPVYFTRAGAAFARNSGSVTRLPDELVEERSHLGRPLAPGAIASVPADFIGRSNEIAQIRTFVNDADAKKERYIVVILCGLAMAGKSALARRLASEFASTFKDMQVTVDLKGIGPYACDRYFSKLYAQAPDAMLTVIRSVHPKQKLGDDANEIKGFYASCFNSRRSILLIENIGSEAQIKDLLPAFTGDGSVLVLATSRKEFSVVQLGLDALVLRLGPLQEADAIALLRSQATGINVSNESAAEIVRLCGLLPLPIRIIGGTFLQKRVSPASVIQLLSDEKRRAELVESTFETTFELYGEEVQKRVIALSVFRSSFDARAAAAVWGIDYAGAELALADMQDYSLVDYDLNTIRYCQNDLLRLFCAGKAHKDPEQLRLWRERFVLYYVNYVERFLEAQSLKASGPDAPVLLEVEKSNLDAMHSYATSLGKPELEARVSKVFSKLGSLLEGSERSSVITLSTSGKRLTTPTATPTPSRPQN